MYGVVDHLIISSYSIIYMLLGEGRILWGRARASVWDMMQMCCREHILQCTLLRPDLAVLPLAVTYASIRCPNAPPWPDLAVLPLDPAYVGVHSPDTLPYRFTCSSLPSPFHSFTDSQSISIAWLATRKFYLYGAHKG